jgi:hypothetical protein
MHLSQQSAFCQVFEGMYTCTDSVKVAIVVSCSGAPTRLASSSITRVARALDLASSAPCTLRTGNISNQKVLGLVSLHLPQLQCVVLPGHQRSGARRALVCRCAFGHDQHTLDAAHVEIRRVAHTEQGDRSMLRSPCFAEVCGGKRRSRFRHDTAASSSY